MDSTIHDITVTSVDFTALYPFFSLTSIMYEIGRSTSFTPELQQMKLYITVYVREREREGGRLPEEG